MGRLVNFRLKWHLESKQSLGPEQSEFRKYYSIHNQVTYLFQTTEDVWPKKRHINAMWNHGNMIQRMRSFLPNRKTRIRIVYLRCKKLLLCQGVPQEESFPQHYSFCPSTIKKKISLIQCTLHCMRMTLGIWCTKEYIYTAKYTLKRSIHFLTLWKEKYIATINLGLYLSTISLPERHSTQLAAREKKFFLYIKV